jgi:hypothetical protein
MCCPGDERQGGPSFRPAVDPENVAELQRLVEEERRPADACQTAQLGELGSVIAFLRISSRWIRRSGGA